MTSSPKAPSGQQAEPTEAMARKIFEICQGWSSATFGWQGDDPDGFTKASHAHDEECIRRIGEALAGLGTASDMTINGTRYIGACPICHGNRAAFAPGPASLNQQVRESVLLSGAAPAGQAVGEALRRARPFVSGQYNGLIDGEAHKVLDMIDAALSASQAERPAVKEGDAQ